VICNGVPVGVQVAWLSSSSSGCPFDVTRVAAVTNCAVTQGPLAVGGGGNEQPETVYVEEIVTVGCPPTVTLVLTTVG